VVFEGPGKFGVHEFGLPEVKNDDAVLRVEFCGICGTDIAHYDGLLDEWGLTQGRTIPGHEPIGIIEQVGPDAAAKWRVKAGDRVAVEPLIPCERCEDCLSGESTKCSGWGKVFAYGMIPADIDPGLYGGYAEHLYLHPNARVHKVSQSLPAPVASLFNPLGAGFRWAYSEPNLQVGETIVILGSGQRGLMSVVAARTAGAGLVIVTDVAAAEQKLDFALELGADAVVVVDREDLAERVSALTGGRMADVVLDATPADSAFHDALRVVRNGGTVILAGSKHGRPSPGIEPDLICIKSVTIRGVLSVDSLSYRRAIRLLERGSAYPFAKMHTATYPLEAAAEAVEHLAGRAGHGTALHVGIAPVPPR
jgi:threonine dehydrogenase-like Zn-dependent dehydrogenase